MGERRGLNPRMMESQSIALPLGYARHLYNNFIILYIISSSNFPLFSPLLFTKAEKDVLAEQSCSPRAKLLLALRA
jgi:hypothetical protein